MNKFLLFLSMLLFCLTGVHFSYSMEMDKEETSNTKRKHLELESQDSTDNHDSEQKESKRRKTEEVSETPMDVDAELVSVDSGVMQESGEKAKKSSEPEGINKLPGELLLIIFEVDFNELLNNKILSKNKIYKTSKAKYLVKQIFDHISKYRAINKDFYVIVTGCLNKNLENFVKKFSLRPFFGIVRMPVFLKSFFISQEGYRALQAEATLAASESHIPTNEFLVTIDYQTAQLKIDFSIADIYKSKTDEVRIHPAEGALIIGLFIRSNASDEFVSKCFTTAGFISLNFMPELPVLEKNFSKDGYCLTPLMWAVFCGHDTLVELLAKYSDVNAICSPNKMYKEYESGDIELRYENVNVFSLAKSEKIMKMLEQAGAEKKVKCLKIFIKHADLDAIKYYFDDTANADTEKVEQLRNAFILATKLGRIEVLEYLFSTFIKTNCFDSKNDIDKAILNATKSKQIEILKFLLKYKEREDIPSTYESQFVTQTGYSQFIPLEQVIPLETVSVLKERLHGDIDSEGNTALMIAAKLGNFEIVELLLKNGFRSKMNYTNNEGMNALMLALDNSTPQKSYQYDKVIRLLEEYGVNIWIPVELDGCEDKICQKYPISQTNDPKLITLFFLNIMKKRFGLSSEAIDQMIKEERDLKEGSQPDQK